LGYVDRAYSPLLSDSTGSEAEFSESDELVINEDSLKTPPRSSRVAVDMDASQHSGTGDLTMRQKRRRRMATSSGEEAPQPKIASKPKPGMITTQIGDFRFLPNPNVFPQQIHLIAHQEKVQIDTLLSLLVCKYNCDINQLAIDTVNAPTHQMLDDKDRTDLVTYLLYTYVGVTECVINSWTLDPLPPQIETEWRTWCRKQMNIKILASKYTATLKALMGKSLGNKINENIKKQHRRNEHNKDKPYTK
jgi:hypothetical protein